MKKQRGITLIALVITIIVLLILAGVSISMVVGENGIVSKATDAKEKTQSANDDEEKKMQDATDYIDEYVMHEAIKWCEKNKLPYTLEEIDENRVNMLDDKEKQQILKFMKDSNIL